MNKDILRKYLIFSLCVAAPSIITSILIQYILCLKSNLTDTIILTLFFCSTSTLLFSRIITLILQISISFLLPHAILTNGLLKKSMLDVAISSNISEVVQYYKSIPTIQVLYSLILSILFIVFFIYQCKNIKSKSKSKKIIFIFLIILFAFISKKVVYMTYYDDINSIVNEYNALRIDKLPTTTWEIKNISKKYNTYVVIIGESMRSDFMSLYGFKEKTTPHIDEIPKKYITNYISTAINTTLSVPRILAHSNNKGKIREEDNIITLAKMAGFKTYWISSQGYTGKYNISTSRISNFADYKHFNDWDDYSLLPIVKQVLRSSEKKVVFIHIVGSHEYPCYRLNDYGIIYNSPHGELINCYLSTYNKTDDFINEVYGSLKENGDTFSLAYFSDHALNIIGKDNDYKIYRNDAISQSYKIPFFIASSDDKNTTKVDITRSAYNFFNYFPEWIGVTTNLTPPGYDIFSNKSDNPVVMSYDEKLKFLSEKSDGLTASEIYK
ncbi:phosphoethanolamine transferase [Proteus faecis]|uniref:phosphoethanolamine transferase n=1 Tax=Proteus faecis TaxID=2050967 RepID=UPI00301C1C6D